MGEVVNGTVKRFERGDIVVVGTAWGRVRAMEDDTGARISRAGPSVPVLITGLSEVPEAGDTAYVAVTAILDLASGSLAEPDLAAAEPSQILDSERDCRMAGPWGVARQSGAGGR